VAKITRSTAGDIRILVPQGKGTAKPPRRRWPWLAAVLLIALVVWAVRACGR
jgi:hypothetical protein